LIFRHGTKQDTGQLSKLGLCSYGQLKDHLTDEHWEVIRSSMAAEPTFSDLLKLSTCFVCEDNGQIIGMAFYVPSGNPTSIFRDEWCYLRLVGVNPQYGGKGIGRKLTQMCIGLARETHEKTIALHTSDFMDTARHIYESLGFEVLKELPERFGRKYWVYTMDL
jgi:GNAT superfamily N-acetyltransferase